MTKKSQLLLRCYTCVIDPTPGLLHMNLSCCPTIRQLHYKSIVIEGLATFALHHYKASMNVLSLFKKKMNVLSLA